MLDTQLLRDDIDSVAKSLASRGFNLDIQKFNALEKERKALQVSTQEIQNKRNVLSKEIGQAKGRGENVEQLMATVAVPKPLALYVICIFVH